MAHFRAISCGGLGRFRKDSLFYPNSIPSPSHSWLGGEEVAVRIEQTILPKTSKELMRKDNKNHHLPKFLSCFQTLQLQNHFRFFLSFSSEFLRLQPLRSH